MANLKVELKIDNFSLMLDGEEKTVISEAAVYRDYFLNNLRNITRNLVVSEDPAVRNVSFEKSGTSYPELKEVVMKDIPKTEIEWILIYSLYASDFGVKPFTETNIREYYDLSKRRNQSRMKNFTTNFSKNVSNNYIKVLNQNEYILTPIGKENADKILNNSSDTSGKNRRKSSDSKSDVSVLRTKKGRSKSNSSITISHVTDLNLKPKDKTILKDFYKGYILTSNFEKNTLFLYYLKRVLGLSDVGINHIYTSYKEVSERIPGNIYQSLIDTKNKKGWIDTKNVDDLNLTISGENYVEYDMKKIGD